MSVQEAVREAGALRQQVRVASLFQSQRRQAVRIPRGFEFTGVEAVEVERLGDALVLRPSPRKRKSWASLIGTPKLDFVLEREPLVDENRLAEGAK